MRLTKHNVYPGRGLGMWAFWLHRLTGLALAIYLPIHILVISTVVGGASTFNDAMKFLKAPLFVLFEMGLLAVVLIHGLNGLRIVLFDLGYGVKHQKVIFVVLMFIALVLFVIGFAIALPHILV